MTIQLLKLSPKTVRPANVPNLHDHMHFEIVNTNAPRSGANGQSAQVDQNTPRGIHLWQKNGDATLDVYICHLHVKKNRQFCDPIDDTPKPNWMALLLVVVISVTETRICNATQEFQPQSPQLDSFLRPINSKLDIKTVMIKQCAAAFTLGLLKLAPKATNRGSKNKLA